MSKVDEVSLRIAASPERLWGMIADVPRMPEWSPALWRCSWRGEVREPVAGARFIGYNRTGAPMPNVVEKAERGREFAFRTKGHNTVWRYLLTPDGDGTLVTEQRDTSRTRHGLMKPIYRLVGGQQKFAEHFRDGMRRTLERLRAAAES